MAYGLRPAELRVHDDGRKQSTGGDPRRLARGAALQQPSEGLVRFLRLSPGGEHDGLARLHCEEAPVVLCLPQRRFQRLDPCQGLVPVTGEVLPIDERCAKPQSHRLVASALGDIEPLHGGLKRGPRSLEVNDARRIVELDQREVVGKPMSLRRCQGSVHVVDAAAIAQVHARQTAETEGERRLGKSQLARHRNDTIGGFYDFLEGQLLPGVTVSHDSLENMDQLGRGVITDQEVKGRLKELRGGLPQGLQCEAEVTHLDCRPATLAGRS